MSESQPRRAGARRRRKVAGVRGGWRLDAAGDHRSSDCQEVTQIRPPLTLEHGRSYTLPCAAF
jgi:hypothetical protein